jgi:hypothetical protein
MELARASPAAQQAGASVPAPEIDQHELYFLVAHALAGGPLAHIGAELAREASERGLLPSRYDVTGEMCRTFDGHTDSSLV